MHVPSPSVLPTYTNTLQIPLYLFSFYTSQYVLESLSTDAWVSKFPFHGCIESHCIERYYNLLIFPLEDPLSWDPDSLLVPTVLQWIILSTHYFAQMWKSVFVEGKLLVQRVSPFRILIDLAKLPRRRVVPILCFHHLWECLFLMERGLMPETTLSRYPRCCPLLRNAIQWTPFSDSCCKGQ